MPKKMSKMKKLGKSAAKALAFLKRKLSAGKKYVYLYYTRNVDGKRVPNVRKLVITGALLAAAAGGTYAIRKHRKHGTVLVKKKK